MATTFVDTIQVTNISNQLVPINIQALVNSSIFTGSGQIQLASLAQVEAEDNRFDLSQLTSLRKKNLITTTSFRRQVTVTGSDATATDASA